MFLQQTSTPRFTVHSPFTVRTNESQTKSQTKSQTSRGRGNHTKQERNENPQTIPSSSTGRAGTGGSGDSQGWRVYTDGVNSFTLGGHVHGSGRNISRLPSSICSINLLNFRLLSSWDSRTRRAHLPSADLGSNEPSEGRPRSCASSASNASNTANSDTSPQMSMSGCCSCWLVLASVIEPPEKEDVEVEDDDDVALLADMRWS